MTDGYARPPAKLRLRRAGGRPAAALSGANRRPIALALRWGRLLAGLGLFALGLALMIRADLGLSAWDVLHDALRALTPLTFGEAVVAVSVVVLVVSMALRVRPGPGTIANAVLVGVFTDAILRAPILDDLASGSFAPRLVVMLAGIWTIALGSALYISARLGAGPRDALMLGLALRTGRSAGAARTAIEAGVLVAGVSLGGSAGVGTAAFVILIGPAIDVSFRLFGMQSPREKHRVHAIRRAARAARRWTERGQLGAESSRELGRHTGGRI